MPRVNRRVPEGMNRFNYWFYDVAVPRVHVRLHVPSLAQQAHADCQAEFQALLAGTSQASKTILERRRKNLASHLGKCAKDQRVFALGFYIDCDKLWQQDQDAWNVMNSLPQNAQRRLQVFDRMRWRYRSRWTWPVLLQSIARDHEVFREVQAHRPAGVGLTGRKGQVVLRMKFKWQTYRYQPEMAMKVYGMYRYQLRQLVKSGQTQQQGLHWFTHALRNLTRYRAGHAPLPFISSCESSCRRHQQQLC